METLVRVSERCRQATADLLISRVGGRRDRGDVPGWVLITLMTAGIVTVLWGFASDRLLQLFTEAINGVTGPGR